MASRKEISVAHTQVSIPNRPINPDLDMTVTLSTLQKAHWIAVFYRLKLTGITQNIAANCSLNNVQGNSLQLVLASNQMAVYNEEQKRRIQVALSEYFDEPVKLSIEAGESDLETPAAYRNRKEQERLQDAIVCFENDGNVQEIIQRFDATIQPNSIEALTPKVV